MAKDIKLKKGDIEISISENNLEHFKKLGFKPEEKKVANKPEKVIKEIIEKEF
jgi:hypothetical protein